MLSERKNVGTNRKVWHGVQAISLDTVGGKETDIQTERRAMGSVTNEPSIYIHSI